MKKPERKRFTWRERLACAVGGCLIIVSAYGHILRGEPIYTNRQGLDGSADFGIFLGVLCLLAAVFPWSRIHFLWDAYRKKDRR
jgi:drug/metabolite transporter (DMT)-like permease